MASDVELLRLEIETMWSVDESDRIVRERQPDGAHAPYLVIGAVQDGHTIAISDQVPDAVAVELQRVLSTQRPSNDPAAAPAAMPRSAELLDEALGPIQISSGPSYVVPEGTRLESDVAIRQSTDETSDLRGRIPEGSGWRSDEWEELLDGELGPWAMAMIEDRVVSVCHTPRLAERGAEAGTWTAPDVRGRGYAAATTAAWASLLAGSGRVLFYSTSATNASSQRVAARLGLPLIGWLWKVTPAT